MMRDDPNNGEFTAYLDRLGLSAEQQAAFAHAAIVQAEAPAAFAALHADLADKLVDASNPAFDSLGARLHLTLPGEAATGIGMVGLDAQGHARLGTTPKLARVSMVPLPAASARARIGIPPQTQTVRSSKRPRTTPT
jgi:hypothetical protein